MPNPCRPVDDDYGCEPGDDGACVHCGHVTCLTCGTRVLPEAARTASDGNRFCAGCWVEEDSDGVPLPVGDDDTSAVKTVRLQNDAGIVETGRAWAEDLCRRAA